MRGAGWSWDLSRSPSGQPPAEPYSHAVRRWLVPVTVTVVVTVLAAVASTRGLPPLGTWEDPVVLPSPEASAPVRSAAAVPSATSQPSLPPPPPLPEPWPDWVQDALLLATGLVVAGALLWVTRRVQRTVRLRHDRRARPAVSPEPLVDEEQVHAELTWSLEELRSGADVFDAIVTCWRRLERLAGEYGLQRQPTMTSQDFVVAVLARTEAPSGDLQRLAALYRQAYYGGQPSTEEHRAEAVGCLERLVAVLHPAGQP